MTEGYAAIRERTAAMVHIMGEIARVIGEQPSEPISLPHLVPNGLGLATDARVLRERCRDLDRGLFTILVVGEFKSGKSTLLNSMLGAGTLPAKATPCTAIITVLVHGQGNRVSIYEADRSGPRLLDWDGFVREFQLSLQDQETLQEGRALDRFSQVQYAEIESAHRLCENGVRLVDSPGLGEHLSRTRLTTNYLKQAQAVIFVLNATRILGQSEREFIQNELGGGRLSNVFFVVNRMDQVNPRDVAEIKAWVETCLTPHIDPDLYRQRVFFVSAKQALGIRAGTGDEAALLESGVPGLEAALEQFLTGGDRVTAVLRSTVDMVDRVTARACQHIEQRLTALDQPIAELERRRVEAETRLQGLQRRKDEIERTVALFGEVVQGKIYTGLRTFIEEMAETWPEDSRQLIDLDSAVSLKNLLTSYAQPGAKERMAEAIGEQVQRYLQVKFGQWLDRVPAEVEGDVTLMMSEVEAQIDEFELALEEIASAFSGATSVTRSQRGKANLADLVLTMQDIHGVTDSMLFPSDWTEMVGTMAQQAVAIFLVGTFLTGGNFLIALLAVEALHLGVHEHEAKKRLRRDLGQRLHRGLQDQVQEKRGFIEEAIQQRFRALGRMVTAAVQHQIDEIRGEQERVLRQKRDESFSASYERDRLLAIAERLRHLRHDLDAVASIGDPERAVRTSLT